MYKLLIQSSMWYDSILYRCGRTGVDVTCSMEKQREEAGLAPAKFQCTTTKIADYLSQPRADNTT